MIAADLKGDPDNHAATPTDESPDNHATSTVVDGAEGSGTLQTNGAYHHFMVNGSEFRVDRKYSPLKALGHGAYGVVCSALNTETNAYVAIKKVPLAFEDRTDAKRMLRECKLLNHFDHENIVALRDIIPPCQEPFPCSFDDIYFVMDLMETDLHKIIYSSNELTDDHLQYFIYQILRGLQYVHSANVIHRDLKPSNLLLNSSCDIKLCDFGLARGVNDEEDYELTEYVVTRHYRAPEVMCCNQHYDHKIDVWSAGCILAELHGREPIFPGDDYLDQMNLIFSVLGTPSDSDMKMITNSKAVQYIKSLPKGEPRKFSDLYKSASPEACDLMEKMLTFNPANRISVDDALKHPYLAAFQPISPSACPMPFAFEFEAAHSTKDELRDLMWAEILQFRAGTIPDTRPTTPPVSPHTSATNTPQVPPATIAHDTPKPGGREAVDDTHASVKRRAREDPEEEVFAEHHSEPVATESTHMPSGKRQKTS